MEICQDGKRLEKKVQKNKNKTNKNELLPIYQPQKKCNIN